MKELRSSDVHRLRAAQGWLELGNHHEAGEELERISADLRAHPRVLEMRWHICAQSGQWDACADLARAITHTEPNGATGWLHLAYSVRRMDKGSVKSAWDTLVSVADRFPNVPTVAFNLACYACLLGNLNEGWHWLEKAAAVGDARQVKSMALNEPDLKPFWKRIAKWRPQ